jgi:branched-chain amino acid transport system permease protein
MFVQELIVYTLVTGGVWALLAVGFSLIFGVARMINLAHTAFWMLAAYVMYYFYRELDLGAPASIIISIVVVGLLGVLVYKVFIDRIREHHAAVLLMTIALALLFQEIVFLVFSGNTLGMPSFIPGYVDILGFSVLTEYPVTLGMVAVLITILWLLLSKTKLGIAIRATAQDAEIANLMGISTSRVLLITMGIAAALAAVAGSAMGPLWSIYPTMWATPLTMIMVIVVVGGLGSIKGSVIGAFFIGFVNTLVNLAFPRGGYLSTTFVLLAMVIVLIVRPGGLFGIMFEEERL